MGGSIEKNPFCVKAKLIAGMWVDIGFGGEIADEKNM